MPLCFFLQKPSSITFFAPEAYQLDCYLCTVEFRVNEDRPTIDRNRRIKCNQRVKQKQRSKLSFLAEITFSISFQHCITCARWNIGTSSRFYLIPSEPAHTISKHIGGDRFLGCIGRFMPYHARNSQITLSAPRPVHSVKLSGVYRDLYYGGGPREIAVMFLFHKSSSITFLAP